MKVSEGGVGLADILAMDDLDFSEALEAADDLEKRIADAAK